jgi:hypothetical protein
MQGTIQDILTKLDAEQCGYVADEGVLSQKYAVASGFNERDFETFDKIFSYAESKHRVKVGVLADGNAVYMRALSCTEEAYSQEIADKVFFDTGLEKIKDENMKVFQKLMVTRQIRLVFSGTSDPVKREAASTLSEISKKSCFSLGFTYNLTASELGFLNRKLDSLTAYCNPILEDISEDEFTTMVEAIKKHQVVLSDLDYVGVLRLFKKSLQIIALMDK